MGKIIDELGHPDAILRLKNDSGSQDTHYSVFCERLPEEYKLVAEQDLNETTANKEKCLRGLKEFAKKEDLSTTDDLLLTVLRSCKFNLKKSESKLKRYLKTRRTIIQKLCRLDDETIELILEDTVFSVLPYRDKHGRTIVTTKPTWQLDKYSVAEVEPLVLAMLMYLLNFPMTTVCGVSYIGESKCDSLLALYPVVKGFKPAVSFAFDFPLRYTRTDILNENFLIRLAYTAIRPILPEKLSKRVFFNGDNYKNLHKTYHPDILPKDYEGNLDAINDKFYRERLTNYIQELREEGRKLNF